MEWTSVGGAVCCIRGDALGKSTGDVRYDYVRLIRRVDRLGFLLIMVC